MLAMVTLSLLLVAGCEPPRSPVSSGRDLPYPDCGGQVPPAGEVIAGGSMRSGPNHRERHIVERWEIRRRGCLYVATGHQEWPLGIVDVEIVYDATWKALRAWRRTAIPGTEDGRVDTRRYELRTPTVGMKRLSAEGTIQRYTYRGGAVTQVIASGRGLVTPWILRERLPVGGIARARVLDIRGDIEKVDDAALRRDPDLTDPDLGRVRVYTFYGRESVFAGDDDHVIADLAGLRPDRVLRTPAPAPLPQYGTLDPVNTP